MLSVALLLGLGISGLAGCGGGTSDPTAGPGGDPTTGADPTTSVVDPTTGEEPSVDPVVVNSVTITDDEGEEPNTDVFDNSDIQLKADVSVSNSSDNKDRRVTWSVNVDPSIATITSTGLLTIYQLTTETAEIVVTATSKVDESKSASVTFNAKHSLINLLNSRPLSLNTEDYFEDGVLSNDDNTQDTALVFADVYDTRWYIEAEIRVMSLDPNDAYPKFGLMTGTSPYGAWQNGEDPFGFYYVDLAQASTNSWGSVNFVVNNDAKSDWNWGGQLGGAALGEKIETGKKFKLGLLRDGMDYYYYYGSDSNNYETYKCYRHIEWNGIPADTPSYAWVGGFRTATKVSGFKYLAGDDVDAMYTDLTTFDIEKKDIVLFQNETSKINLVTPAHNYKASDFTYTSEDPTVATVDSTGTITAVASKGTTRISVKYKDTLEVFVNVTVTDDPKFSVVLDGKLDDAIWTDTVKSRVYKHTRTNIDVDISLLAARNSRGVYMHATYVASEVFSSGNWWEDDNMEFRFVGENGFLQNKHEVDNNTGNPAQYWISQFNGGQSNFTDEYISAETYDESTGMYTIIFEMFASYEWLNCAPDAKIGFNMGANPGGAYWWNDAAWNNSDLSINHKITEDGIVRYYDETGCEHTYGAWKVITEPSCENTGLREHFCKWCNHREEEILPESHNYVGEITANSEGSCMGVQACIAGCGATTPVVMDSYTTHEAWDEELGICTACHNHVNGSEVFDRWDLGGWDDHAIQYEIVDGLVGEYDVEIKFTVKVNDANQWWRGVLPIVQDADVENGSVFVTRFDWWGWVDVKDSGTSLANKDHNADKNGGALDNPEWMPDAGANWYSTWADPGAKVTLRMKKTATDIINEWTVTPLGGNNAGTVWSGQAKIINPRLDTSIRLALAAEFATATITGIYYHTATFAA